MSPYKILFSITLASGTLLAISSFSWMMMWFGLEINLLSMIPLLKNTNKSYSSEATLKYFLSQALASILLLFSLMVSTLLTEFIPLNSSNHLFMLMLNSALFTKLGAPPFHYWFPEVMEGSSWVNCLVLATWQKIAPMILIMYNSNLLLFLATVIMFSSITSGLIGVNQVSLRKIMAYSSINHIAWMMSSIVSSQTVWLIYFIVYTIVSTSVILMFKEMNVLFVSQLIEINSSSLTLKLAFMVNLLSMSGLPPLLGFFPKWMTINVMVLSNLSILAYILTVSTLITMYFYLRMSFSSMSMNTTEKMILHKKLTKTSISKLVSLTSLGLAPSMLIFSYA